MNAHIFGPSPTASGDSMSVERTASKVRRMGEAGGRAGEVRSSVGANRSAASGYRTAEAPKGLPKIARGGAQRNPGYTISPRNPRAPKGRRPFGALGHSFDRPNLGLP